MGDWDRALEDESRGPRLRKGGSGGSFGVSGLNGAFWNRSLASGRASVLPQGKVVLGGGDSEMLVIYRNFSFRGGGG